MLPIIANASTSTQFNLYLVVFGLAGAILIAVGKRLYLSYHEKRLPAVAENLGLNYTRFGGEGSTTLTGNYRSIPIFIYEEVRGSGKYKHTVSIYHIKLNPSTVPRGLVVYRESLTSKVAKAFGTEDIQIGHELIDRKFIIQGAFTEDCDEFFTRPGVADYFIELLELCKGFRLENNLLILDFKQGIAVSRNHLRTRLETLTRCAHAIARTDPRVSAQQLPAAQKHPVEPIDPFATPLPSPTNRPGPQNNSIVHW